MKNLKIMFLLAAFVFASAALAGEGHQTKIRVAIAEGDSSDEIQLNLNGEEMGFDLEEMQVGETRSVVDETGRTILVTREANGFKFDIDGKAIQLPLFGAEHGAMWVNDDSGENVEVHVMRDAKFVSGDSFDGVTILSGQPIDDETRESIKSLLISSGHSGDVEFIDPSGSPHGLHEVRVIKQEVSD